MENPDLYIVYQPHGATMSDKKLRLGFIGAGGIAQAQMSIVKAYPDVELIACCDINDQSLAKAKTAYGFPAVYTDWKEMLRKESFDAVSVCTPNGGHCAHTIGALKAGAHVLVEKPLSMNVKEGEAMLAAAKKAGRKLIIGFQWRFHPKAQFIRRMSEDGGFGKILFARCKALRRRGIPNWGVFGRKDLQGGGPLIDIGVHILEVTHYVMGSPRPVAASGQIFQYLGNQKSDIACSWPNWDHKSYTVEDLAVGQIRFDTGAVLQVEASFAAHCKDEWNFSIMGEKGGADMDPLAIHTDEHGFMVDKTPAFLPQDDCFAAKLRKFVDTVLHGKPTEAPGEAGLMVQKMLDGIYESAEKGREVVIR
jgi:predicted dehydrogenase